MASQIEQVITNWLREAHSSVGRLGEGVDAAGWVAQRLVEWLKSQAQEPLESAAGAAQAVRKELDRLGGWNNKELGEALHEVTHIEDSLGDLRSILELEQRDSAT